MGKEYKGSIDVKHFVHVLVEEVGLDKIRVHAPPRLLELKWRATLDVSYLRPEYINHDDPWEPKISTNSWNVQGLLWWITTMNCFVAEMLNGILMKKLRITF